MDNELKTDLKKHILKTGTTTVGIVCKDGIVLAADKRGTYGGDHGVSYVASRDEEKVQKVTEEIVVTTAGNASDLQKVIKLARAELKLKELRSKLKVTIKQASNLFASIAYQNIRQFTTIPGITHFLLSGYDSSGVYLYEIHADGYLQTVVEYSVTGSGLIHANPILDTNYKKNISITEGIELAKKCINASTRRDPGSGEGMDIFVIKQNEIKQVVKQEIVSEFRDIK